MPTMITNRVLCLPNDMYVVMTAAGDVLVNSPPESLKFLLAHGLTPPRYVVLPPDAPPGSEPGSHGFVYRGINYASVEFLIYANFFRATTENNADYPNHSASQTIARTLERNYQRADST